MRRWTVIAAIAAVVIGLVAINLMLFDEPEPELTQMTRRPDRRTERRLTWSREETVDSDGAEPDPIELEPGEETAPTTIDPDAPPCDHPLIPASAGQARRYRWTASDQDRAAELSFTATELVGLEDGDVRVGWRVRVLAEDDRSALTPTATLHHRCTPGADAEDPWFGILERAMGLRVADDSERWRWPRELRAGVRFAGSVVFDARGSETRLPDGVDEAPSLRVTRRHRVEGRERVVVDAGTFTAWRVSYEEAHTVADRTTSGPGTIWIAPEVGMVKSVAENSAGITHTIELTGIETPEP